MKARTPLGRLTQSEPTPQTGDSHCTTIDGKPHATGKAETLLKRVARPENEVQVANDDSTAWMERFHEQCGENHHQSLQIDKAASSLGSRLIHLNLRAQIQSLEPKYNSLGSDLRGSECIVSILKELQKQREGRLISTISILQRRINRQVRHERKHIPNTLWQFIMLRLANQLRPRQRGGK